MRGVHSEGNEQAQHRMVFRVVGSLVVGLALVAGAIVWLSLGNAEARAKQQIHELLTRRANALNHQELTPYLSCFSKQYQSGQQRYADLRKNATRWFSEFADIRFSFHIVDIQIQQRDMALVENDYTFSLTGNEGETFNIAKRELLEIHHEDTGWKIARTYALEEQQTSTRR